ncbi:hypothetical protein F511_20491 [Dorcoceras hygrometricum]|uniref:Mucin-2-like n=1 Tax=Dorcoceras hygrometricum TaxID=472368 RepID=A0A2Z7BA21_9LAMI|nr:hypothetical protein F511_20491 [Dorcoceras hygrometricum]
MASSYYNNTLHVNFESVLAMDDPGMVSMFQALMASGLEGFFGCPAVIYEAALVDFFENASVRDGVVVSTVHGVTVEISEQLFAETFELPVEGLSELSEIPKDLVFDVRSIISLFGEPLSYDDTLPSVSTFFKMMKKRWADVCLEVSVFSVSGKLLPVGSVNFRQSLSVVEPVVSSGSPQPTVFAFQLSQFCIVFLQYSLFSSMSTADIHDFVSTIAMDRKILRNVQLASASVSSIDQEDNPYFFQSPESSFEFSQRQDSPHSAAVSPLRFISNYISMADDTTRFSNSLVDLQTLLSERIGDSHNDVLSRLHTLDKGFRDVLLQQGEDLRNLIQNEFRALNAKVTSLDEQVAATRNDLLEFRAQAQETLNHITDQLSELIYYINRGGNDKKGEVSSSRPQPPPDDQNRGSGNSGGGSGVRSTDIVDSRPQPPPDDQNRGSGNSGGGSGVRSTDIVDRFSGGKSRDGQNRGRSGGRHNSGNRSGSSKRRNYSSNGGTFRRSFGDWLG